MRVHFASPLGTAPRAPGHSTAGPLGRFSRMAPAVDAGPMPTSWAMLAASSSISLAAGLVTLVYPGITLSALSIIVGVALLFWGGAAVGRAVASIGDDHGPQLLSFLVGALGIMAGIVSLVRPGATILALVLTLAFWWLWTGAAELTSAAMLRWHRGTHLVLGALSVVAGLIIIADPTVGVATLAAVTGVFFLLRGVGEAALAMAVRRSQHRA